LAEASKSGRIIELIEYVLKFINTALGNEDSITAVRHKKEIQILMNKNT
jgi:hypothetical protein